MKGLREGAMLWRISCSYDHQGRNDDHMLQVSMSQLDPLRSHNKIVCSEVQIAKINGVGCYKCVIGMANETYDFNCKRIV